jgi:hypothetical protein
MTRKDKKALALILAKHHYDKAQALWDLFRKTESILLLEKAEIIGQHESFDIALEAMHMALDNTKND